VCAGGDRGAVEDNAAVEILGVTRPIPDPLLAPDPGVAILNAIKEMRITRLHARTPRLSSASSRRHRAALTSISVSGKGTRARGKFTPLVERRFHLKNILTARVRQELTFSNRIRSFGEQRDADGSLHLKMTDTIVL